MQRWRMFKNIAYLSTSSKLTGLKILKFANRVLSAKWGRREKGRRKKRRRRRGTRV